MCALATDRQSTIVRPIETSDIRPVMRLLDTAWRIHLRVSPVELRRKIQQTLGFVAEDRVGLRGFMVAEPLPSNVALLVAVGLRDTWHVAPYLDVLLPALEQSIVNNNLDTLVYIGNAIWLTEDLKKRGFTVREQVIAFERPGQKPPPEPNQGPAYLRIAHRNDLLALLALDQQTFTGIWHKSLGNLNQALAQAASFSVALIDDQIVAYEWCEIYKEHAHLTRLAVHPNYQGQGIGGQLLHQAITDALTEGADIITLNTQATNQRSQGLYKRFGFVDTKQRMPVLRKLVSSAYTR